MGEKMTTEYSGMVNRYDGSLREHDREIDDLAPSNRYLRVVLAHELKNLYRPGMSVLELGCGTGLSAEPILEYTDVSMTLLDVSAEMVAMCRKNLSRYGGRLQYVEQDACQYLNTSGQNDIIHSSWVIHNFTWTEKSRLFEAIHRNLKEDGTFMTMDKIYPSGDSSRRIELLDQQIDRYVRYLTPGIAEKIIRHEETDYDSAYRMDETPTVDSLRHVGFRNVRIVERLERDVVLIAQK